jgi:hypothetical protein
LLISDPHDTSTIATTLLFVGSGFSRDAFRDHDEEHRA